jgi:hypothetical protein
VLDDLDKIDWESIRHRDGPATDIPKLLRDLISEDKKAQSGAVLELFKKIWYHGTVYEATSKAVPFLYEILENPSCSERFSIAWLLGSIANGCTNHKEINPKNKNEVEMIWVKEAHGAILKGVKTALGLLGEIDKDLRLPIILLLASLPEEAAQITPIMSSMLSKEKNDETRAGLGLALALLGDFHFEAFRSENTKLPLLLIETLAKACFHDKRMRFSAYQTIEECLLSTVGQEDKDWLKDENFILDSTNLN